ncbi:MAG TPA: hypothetical protein VI670_26270 [Thermoanaerobaculia bacterium]|jgi:hypothetical protein
MTPDEEAAELAVVARVKRTSLWAYAAFAVVVLIFRGFNAFVGLTCSAAVTMISFLWLEEILTTILQPSSHTNTRRLTLRALARFVLLGVAISVTIFVARFDAVSVLLGFSVVVVGIIGEAVVSAVKN